MKARDVIRELEQLAPPAYAESWDNVGLLVGSDQRAVHKVYLALDADSQAVRRAVAEGCDLLLTHHPLLFSAVKSIREDDFIGGRLLLMIEHHLNYYAMHTNFDVAVMADLAAERLKLQTVRPLDMVRETPEGIKGIGCTGELPEMVSLQQLAAQVKAVFELPQVRVYGPAGRMIRRVSMCPGSGKGMDAAALAAGAQVLITGDVDHHYGLDCMEKGLCVIDAGHHGLEHLFVDYMADWLETHFPELELVKDRNESPFWVVESQKAES